MQILKNHRKAKLYKKVFFVLCDYLEMPRPSNWYELICQREKALLFNIHSEIDRFHVICLYFQTLKLLTEENTKPIVMEFYDGNVSAFVAKVNTYIYSNEDLQIEAKLVCERVREFAMTPDYVAA